MLEVQAEPPQGPIVLSTGCAQQGQGQEGVARRSWVARSRGRGRGAHQGNQLRDGARDTPLGAWLDQGWGRTVKEETSGTGSRTGVGT